MLTLLLAKETTVGQALAMIRQQVDLELPTVDAQGQPYPVERSVRMMELFNHRIYKVFGYDEEIDGINDQYWTIRAEVRNRNQALTDAPRCAALPQSITVLTTPPALPVEGMPVQPIESTASAEEG